MFSYARKQFGTAGLVVAIVALIAALAGGAWAATGGLTAKQKREVKSIARSFQGTGPVGPVGAKGDPGAPGKDGTSGKDGVSPTGTAFPGNANGCTEGGVEIKGANTAFVCNGKKGTNGTNGTNGADGDPWAAGGLLPPKATETGIWGGISTGDFMYPVTFFLPLSSAPTPVFVQPGKAGIDDVASCPGFVNGAPTAKPGKLCIYAAQMAGGAFSAFVDPSAEEAQGASTTGTLLLIDCNEECATFGTFAVTGPET